MQDFKDLWVDKYRPIKLDDMVLNENTKRFFDEAIKKRNLTNFTVIGPPGFGKTTLALLLAKELDADYLFIPCATEGGIDTLRTKITQFVKAYSEKLKIVILDEIDSASASQDSSFQKGLRNLIEMSPDTRFICTANYNKIIPAVLSRCPLINIQFTEKQILQRILDILEKENINYSSKDTENIAEIIKFNMPDIRSIITTVQRHVFNNNTFDFSKNLGIIENVNTVVNSIIQDCLTTSLIKVRQNYITNIGKNADYTVLASKLFNHVLEKNLITNPDYLRRMTQAIFEINMCVDKELSFFGLVCIIYVILVKNGK